MRRLLQIALNPFFQSLVFAGLVILLLPFGIPKYSVKQVDLTVHFDKSSFVFADLDHDSVSERIHTCFNDAGNVAIVIRKSGLPDQQWNFRGIYQPNTLRTLLGDYDRNGIDEIYIFTLVNDSLMLHGLEVSREQPLFISNRFVAHIGKNLKDPDFIILPGKVTDMTGDGIGELVFGVAAGFSLQPRNIYSYDIVNDSLYQSPLSGVFIADMMLHDIDGDGFDEILLQTYASDNYNDEDIPFHDSSSWLMLLDHTLQYLFPPIEYKGRTGDIAAVVIQSQGEKLLLVYSRYFPGSIYTNELSLFNHNGERITSKKLMPKDKYFDLRLIMNLPESWDRTKILAKGISKDIFTIDAALNIQKVANLSFNMRVFEFRDVDQDGKEEMILLKTDQEQHFILRDDFTHPVDLDIPIQAIPPRFSVKINGKDPPQLSVQGDREWKLFDYGLNPIYLFRHLLYLGIYLLILLFILIIRKLYAYQLLKRFENEKKMVTMQLAGIKAQMEPHFIFNVINSIGANIYKDDKEKAYQLVLRFSDMVRSLLSTSDKLTRTLREEIDFVKNFLELERSRFPELFSSQVKIEEGVDLEALVPKMIIQLHAENALKHGLKPKGIDGLIDIRVETKGEYLLIQIQDNGVGRIIANNTISDSTGKGMKILQQLFETYNKHNRIPIKQEIIDLFDEDRNSTGTIVRIWVPLEFNERIY